MTGDATPLLLKGLGSLEIGEEYAAILSHNPVSLVSSLAHAAIGGGGVVADTIGDVGHDSVECERIGTIGFGIGQGLAKGVVVLGGFHATFLSYSANDSLIGHQTNSAGPSHN